MYILCYICAKVVGKSRGLYHASDINVNSDGQRVGRGPGP